MIFSKETEQLVKTTIEDLTYIITQLQSHLLHSPIFDGNITGKYLIDTRDLLSKDLLDGKNLPYVAQISECLSVIDYLTNHGLENFGHNPKLMRRLRSTRQNLQQLTQNREVQALQTDWHGLHHLSDSNEVISSDLKGPLHHNSRAIDELQEKIGNLENLLRSKFDSFNSDIKISKQQTSNDLHKFNKLHEYNKKELNEREANYVKKFKALESQYEESLDNLTKQQKNFIEELEKNHQTQIDTLNNDIKAIVESNQHEASTGVEKINKLVGIAANTSITGSFKDNAQRERTGADWNRYGSIASMVVSIFAFVFYEAVFDFNADQELHHAIARFGLTFLLSLLAAYLARESSKHRQQQYNYQQIALEHEALSPYISDLPEEKQHELKIEMAKKLFPGTGNQSKTGTEGLPINIHDLFVELIKKADFKSSTQKESSSSNNAEQGKQTPHT